MGPLTYEQFEAALQRELQRRFGERYPSVSIVLGYSGGLDSEVLAHLLGRFQHAHPSVNSQLLHVHHGLSHYADNWVEHCQASAKRNQLNLTVERIQLPDKSRTSIEAQAREQRYKQLFAHASAPSLVLTAHHQDDQLESVLLGLKRGGVNGLAGIARAYKHSEGQFVYRPLLPFSKEQLHFYAKKHGLQNIEDDSNSDCRFDRNFLRHRIIPSLTERWPHIGATASRSAELIGEQRQLIEDMCQGLWPTFCGPYDTLLIEPWAKQSQPLQRQLLRYWLGERGAVMPSQQQLLQIQSQLLNASIDANVCVEFNQWQVRRFAHKAYALPVQTQPTLAAQSLTLDNEVSYWGKRLRLTEANQGLRLMPTTEVVQLRFGASGSTVCHPHNRHHSRTLKKLWQEHQVPPWMRSKVPLIYYGERLVAAVGYWIEKSLVQSDDEKGWKIIQLD
ncbi:tRNA lysidine(34) synthetase TilS [Paraferrimonas haliotis]|uniref:tRNA(Ile)-lysidine synthase n=1 Tax=Paraferrimonas haliotis TaxID=2013866 RepID=A0AA37TK50_9GAMM|nr:tRNA lysidine(34) synthetase TilS [Paraferrimonas haliotis]GLS82709.1 tRNA(Ile)-lysidine synthase [Paraferrimonas haliotis]